MTEESKTEAQTSPINGVVGVSSKGFQWTIPASVAVLTALSFVAAAMGEWAYYRGLGALDFISLASPADYTSAAMLWLPATLVGMAVGSGYQSITWLLIMGPRQPPDEEKKSRRLEGYLVLTLILLASFLMAWVLHVRTGGNFVSPWLIPGTACWVLFSCWFSRHPHVRFYKLARTWDRLLMVGPLVIAVIIGLGRDQAVSDLAMQRGEYRIVHSTGLVEDDVQLLRALSQGVLILRVPTRDVSFLTYGSFKSIDRVGSSQ